MIPHTSLINVLKKNFLVAKFATRGKLDPIRIKPLLHSISSMTFKIFFIFVLVGEE